MENFDNRVGSGPENRFGAELKNKVREDIPEGLKREKRRQVVGENLLGPTMLGENQNSRILLIGSASMDPTELGPMLDLGVSISKKKRRKNRTRKVPNPKTRAETTQVIKFEKNVKKSLRIDCMKTTLSQ